MSGVALIAAFPGELAPLITGWTRERADGVSLWKGNLKFGDSGDSLKPEHRAWNPGAAALQPKPRAPIAAVQPAVAACAGMGAAAAARAFNAAAAALQIDRVVSVGWAGALNFEFTSGNAYRLAGAVDARTGERYPAAHPGTAWIVTVDHVVSPAEKARLAAAYGAALVDMEAAEVARLARAKGLAFDGLKAVTDGPADRLPDFTRFTAPDGTVRTLPLALHALLRPPLWPTLLRLARRSRSGAQSLADAVPALVVEAASPPPPRRSPAQRQ